MPQPTAFWGIDIGQCALKAIRLEMTDGQPTITAFDYVEHPKILSQPDADPDQLIREALEKFLSRNQIRYDQVAIGIAGQSGLARFVKLPPVEEKKIAEIVKFEAKQQIPFPLDEVVWDYQKIAGGDVTDGFAMETEIGLFAMKRDVISRYLGYFNSARIEVHVVQTVGNAINGSFGTPAYFNDTLYYFPGFSGDGRLAFLLARPKQEEGSFTAARASVEGLRLVEMNEADVCCGFGGTFAVKYGELSDAIVRQKSANVAASGADTLLAGDLGCLMNMAGKLQRDGSAMEVRHVAEVLAGMTNEPAIGAPAPAPARVAR